MRVFAKLGILFILATLFLLPAAVAFPGIVGLFSNQIVTGPYIVGVVAVFDIAVLVVAWLQGDHVTSKLLRVMAKLTIVSLLAAFVLGFDERYSVMDIPNPHMLGGWLGVDGQYAYEADIFEIYCEIWVVLAAILWLSLALGLRILRKCKIIMVL